MTEVRTSQVTVIIWCCRKWKSRQWQNCFKCPSTFSSVQFSSVRQDWRGARVPVISVIRAVVTEAEKFSEVDGLRRERARRWHRAVRCSTPGLLWPEMHGCLVRVAETTTSVLEAERSLWWEWISDTSLKSSEKYSRWRQRYTRTLTFTRSGTDSQWSCCSSGVTWSNAVDQSHCHVEFVSESVCLSAVG